MAREHIQLGIQRECIVISDLVKRGYEVFKALGSSSFDLVIHVAGECARIEVKGICPSRKAGACKGPVNSKRGHSGGFSDRYDILSTVFPDNTIRYQRSIAYPLNPESHFYELISDNEEYDKMTTRRITQRT